MTLVYSTIGQTKDLYSSSTMLGSLHSKDLLTRIIKN